MAAIGEGGGSDQPEYKYYAPGIGGILTEPRYRGGEQETESLLNATQLSPPGVAELSGIRARTLSHRLLRDRLIWSPGHCRLDEMEPSQHG